MSNCGTIQVSGDEEKPPGDGNGDESQGGAGMLGLAALGALILGSESED